MCWSIAAVRCHHKKPSPRVPRCAVFQILQLIFNRRLSCSPLRSTQTECNCGVKLMCLQCHLRLVGTVQSAISFLRATFPVWLSPPADRPSVANDHWESCRRVRRCAWQRDDERSSWSEVSVCNCPHTQNCVQLVDGHRAVCQHYGSLSDRSQQQQHGDSHVGSCHLQRERHWSVEELAIHRTYRVIIGLINKLMLGIIATWPSVDW